MEKAIPEERIVTRDRHLFYCDECGKYLGDSIEYDDGYYEKIGDYTWTYYDKKCGWLYKKGRYCTTCQEKVAGEIANALKQLGFIAGDNF